MNFAEAMSLVNQLGNVSALRPARHMSFEMIHEIETKSLGSAIAACRAKKSMQPEMMTARPVIIGYGLDEVDINQVTTTATTNSDDMIHATDVVADAWTQFTSAAHQIPDNKFVSMHGCYAGPSGKLVYDRLTHVRWKKGSEIVALWNLLDLYDTHETGCVGTTSDTYAGYGEGYSVYQYPVWNEKDYLTGHVWISTGATDSTNIPFKAKGWTVEVGAQVIAPLRKR